MSRSITRAYYRNSVGGLLLFDITNRRSFQNVHEWLEETKVHVQPYQIVFVLVGHKCDLDTQRQVTRHEAEKLAAAYGMKYIETSARDAINVEKAFTDLTRDIYELVKRGDISIQEGWEGVKSGFVPNVVHSSEEVVKSDRRSNTKMPNPEIWTQPPPILQEPDTFEQRSHFSSKAVTIPSDTQQQVPGTGIWKKLPQDEIKEQYQEPHKMEQEIFTSTLKLPGEMRSAARVQRHHAINRIMPTTTRGDSNQNSLSQAFFKRYTFTGF
ncbi:hypothetical protein IHE44_0003178 [Lamprotornis superbus]|uniref:Ras-related protein Rab-39B n=1 Tax=Lamprotornis superbus TaxID=245042 RepID=A0A835TTU9_9PASS|nr:hypothetical protein IHE44_0003178 [Lamprotornis superbus]